MCRGSTAPDRPPSAGPGEFVLKSAPSHDDEVEGPVAGPAGSPLRGASPLPIASADCSRRARPIPRPTGPGRRGLVMAREGVAANLRRGHRPGLPKRTGRIFSNPRFSMRLRTNRGAHAGRTARRSAAPRLGPIPDPAIVTQTTRSPDLRHRNDPGPSAPISSGKTRFGTTPGLTACAPAPLRRRPGRPATRALHAPPGAGPGPGRAAQETTARRRRIRPEPPGISSRNGPEPDRRSRDLANGYSRCPGQSGGAPPAIRGPSARQTSQRVTASARLVRGSRVGMNSWARKPSKPVSTIARQMAG
ncbi:hypothetical protein ElP_37450 [Tautonia plasticadhaerens]|uniref:Uncharacterized protein n=1 Tax=Tautonia plasticadhaerens TaxID=2527974 RepID=A0A518H4T6_9BACT|nr:hypothetical protein ElP_37450 [Tautonia plasticadhaerens]